MRNQSMLNGKEMNFKVENLIKVIQENRDKHAKEYAESVVAYKKKLKSMLEDKLSKVSDTMEDPKDIPDGHVSLSRPRNYLEEYDQYLDMLRMTEDKEISLPISMFNQLVRDKWDWKEGFDVLTSSYI